VKVIVIKVDVQVLTHVSVINLQCEMQKEKQWSYTVFQEDTQLTAIICKNICKITT